MPPGCGLAGKFAQRRDWIESGVYTFIQQVVIICVRCRRKDQQGTGETALRVSTEHRIQEGNRQ